VRELYERWLLELWHGDLAVADEIVAEDFLGHWPDQEVQGRAALVAQLTFRLEVGPIADGDLLAARWTGTGTTPDGGEMPLLGNDILRVADGRLVEYWVASWAGPA
jgi:predicted SnoaL-like aldol condensation-catalyzing enzyme